VLQYETKRNIRGRRTVSCTTKQELLIDKLQTLGATIESDADGDPDFSYLDSVANADKYIKKWIHLYRSCVTKCSAQDWGGIPNH